MGGVKKALAEGRKLVECRLNRLASQLAAIRLFFMKLEIFKHWR
jgi:hypothetical protein